MWYTLNYNHYFFFMKKQKQKQTKSISTLMLKMLNTLPPAPKTKKEIELDKIKNESKLINEYFNDFDDIVA